MCGGESFLFLAASPARGMVTPPTFQIVTSLTSFDSANVSSWSGGGGARRQIALDSMHPFAGREFGGSDRSNLRGSRAFGSGYPYGASSTDSIAGRPFPYGVWPIYWGGNFMGSEEYGPHLDSIRPGGQLVLHEIKGSTERWNVTDDETYYMLCDRETAFAIMTSFVTWCDALPVWPVVFNITGAGVGEGRAGNITVDVSNVVRYYRASSFAFLFRGYNNTKAKTPNSGATDADSDPLPDLVTYSLFRKCLSGVIENALPIVDRIPQKSKTGMIIGIVFGVVIGLGLLCFCSMGKRRSPNY